LKHLSVKDFTLPMAEINPLSNLRSRRVGSLIGCIILTVALFLSPCPARAATIVLDPGHGGNNRGASGSGEFPEKRFTLALAQQIAGLLAGRHRVELTRTADIDIAPADRAAVANHLRADLMISLHTAAAPYCADRTAAVYYHNEERLSFPPEMPIPGTAAGTDGDRPAWARLQIRHQHQSQHLAAAIRRALIDGGSVDTVTVGSAPLVVLMGADLPAVLLEVGCLHPTVPLTAQQFSQQLTDYAEPIAAAIETAVNELAR
jgi:N-acetylmuramoyl-L-alanine amidase